MTGDATLAAQLRRELDDARARLREQGADMQAAIDRLTRERDIAQRDAAGLRAEALELRAEVERLRAQAIETERELSEAYERLGYARDDLAAVCAHCQSPFGESALLAAQRVRRERDEFRAERDRYSDALRAVWAMCDSVCGRPLGGPITDAVERAFAHLREERDDARAEAERLRALVPAEAPKAEPAGCATCPSAEQRFNNGNGATTCSLLGNRIVAIGHKPLTTRPAECPLPSAEPARLRCADGETRRGPDGREWHVQESCPDPYRKHAAWMVIHDTTLNDGDDPDLDSGIVADDVLATWPLVTEPPEVDEPAQGDERDPVADPRVGDLWSWDEGQQTARVTRVLPADRVRGHFEPRIALEGRGGVGNVGWWQGQGWSPVRDGGGR